MGFAGIRQSGLQVFRAEQSSDQTGQLKAFRTNPGASISLRACPRPTSTHFLVPHCFMLGEVKGPRDSRGHRLSSAPLRRARVLQHTIRIWAAFTRRGRGPTRAQWCTLPLCSPRSLGPCERRGHVPEGECGG
jgi:hypothetical protein